MTTVAEPSFASLLRAYRRRAGLTQEELAERAEMSARGLMYLERDERHPQPGTARRLAAALELTVQERVTFLHRASVAVARPTNLPDEPTPFIGRIGEVEQTSALLRDPHIRLVTLTGPGGCGKTRLALKVAALLPEFDDGVFFVNLAPLADPALVANTVAEALGARVTGNRSAVRALTDSLRNKRLLLVLDNYEHLLEAASVVGELLDSCHELHVLVTSRIPLHLAREHVYPVQPLPVPNLERQLTPENLEQFDAVVLFVDRARAVRPDFTLSAENAPAVARMCVRLEGWPLAIELAAARLKIFSPKTLLQRLERRLPLLTGGAKDRPTRQQTLRATIDWSYELLTHEERALFSRLSVFAGGCTIEAADAVYVADKDLDLVEGLASLVDKSLLRRQGEDELRFFMLETIREYAVERLEETGLQAEVRDAHAGFYYQMVDGVEMELVGPDQVAWMRRLDREIDNIRSALSWLTEIGSGREAVCLAGTLWRYWDSRALCEEGRRWLSAALLAAGGADPDGKANQRLGMLLSSQGRFLEAKPFFEKSLKISQQLRDDMTIAATWSCLGALFAGLGDFNESERLHEQSLALRRELGDVQFIAHSLNNLAYLRLIQGRIVEAKVQLEEAVALARHARDTWALADNLALLGIAVLRAGDYDTAAGHLEESARTFRQLGERGGVAPVWGMMAVASCRSEPARAARLSGAVARLEAIYLEGKATLWEEWNRSYVASARSGLDPDTWDQEWEAGNAMSFDEAIAYALDEVESPA